MSLRKPNDESLPGERQKTDKSLRVERQKADEKLESRDAHTAQETDQTVGDTRTELDEKQHRERRRADSGLKDATAGDPHGHSAARVARELADERRSGDEALAAERQRVDTALERERRQRAEASRASLRAERGATDQNLTHERRSADRSIRRTASAGHDEADAHGATRDALTTRDEFLDSLGRDLRTPLAAIASSAELLRGEASYARADDRVHDRMDAILTNARDAQRLLGDLLERIAVWQDSESRQHPDSGRER